MSVPCRSAAEGAPVVGCSLDSRRTSPLTASSTYPLKHRFPGHLRSEATIAEFHAAGGSYQDYTLDDVSRLRALAKLPAPEAFTPRSHRYLGLPTFEHEGPRTPAKRRHFGANERRAPKPQEASQ